MLRLTLAQNFEIRVVIDKLSLDLFIKTSSDYEKFMFINIISR